MSDKQGTVELGGRKMVEWTKPKLKEFVRAYEKARKNGKGDRDSFFFEENEYLVSYAKYLIQYLTGEFYGWETVVP